MRYPSIAFIAHHQTLNEAPLGLGVPPCPRPRPRPLASNYSSRLASKSEGQRPVTVRGSGNLPGRHRVEMACPLHRGPTHIIPLLSSRTRTPPKLTRDSMPSAMAPATSSTPLEGLPNEVLFHVLGFLDVSDLLATSRVNHHLRHLSLTPLLHARRLRDNRAIVSPLLTSPSRPTRSDLVARAIVQPRTASVSRRLARSLISIRLARRLAHRPSAEALVERAVLPRECVPGLARVHVAPGLVGRRRAIERERLKDGLRGFVGAWRQEVCVRGQGR